MHCVFLFIKSEGSKSCSWICRFASCSRGKNLNCKQLQSLAKEEHTPNGVQDLFGTVMNQHSRSIQKVINWKNSGTCIRHKYLTRAERLTKQQSSIITLSTLLMVFAMTSLK